MENCCRFINYKITKKVGALWLAERCVCMRVCKRGFDAVRVQGEISLRNGMWHGLRNDIIMRNLIYAKWRKETNLTGKHACASAAPFLAPIWRSNRFAGPFITACSGYKAQIETQLMHQIGSLFIVTLEGKNARWTWSRASYNSRDF